MTMTEYGNDLKIKVGDVLKGKRTGNLYDVVGYEKTNWAGHGIYSLLCKKTKEARKIADFALYRKYEIAEK